MLTSFADYLGQPIISGEKKNKVGNGITKVQKKLTEKRSGCNKPNEKADAND